MKYLKEITCYEFMYLYGLEKLAKNYNVNPIFLSLFALKIINDQQYMLLETLAGRAFGVW